MLADMANKMMHERLELFEDAASGLRGVISIHSTALGAAAGGCRFWSYASQADAVEDALRLSEGMSYKNALAGLPFGGGKAVIHKPLGTFNRNALFRAFGAVVERLNGSYLTAEDVGTTLSDMAAARTNSRHVAGLAPKGITAGGDPSPWTALGVFETIRACVRHKLGRDLSGVKIAVQGVGNVGQELCRLLHTAGAVLFVADIDSTRAAVMAEKYGAKILPNNKILFADVDVIAPCALGGVLTETSIAKLRAGIIVGGANNQLATALDGQRLVDRDILYAPDYVVNAGGIINVVAEYLGESSNVVENRVHQIADRVLQIVKKAEAAKQASSDVADNMARTIIRQGRAKNKLEMMPR
jgi:leucine dehydrogenase